MKKKEVLDSIIIVLFGLGLIAMGLFTDYTLSIGKIITIPSWLTIAIGIIIIIGWFILSRMPDKYDEEGNPLKKEQNE
ncbi:MAG: hypothetical protein WC269_06860 [Candidatus Gracilibacteria bacterium]|jgi:hypothetical protein